MKQLNSTILLTMLLCMFGVKASAYDLAIENADGQTIFYNYINDGKELEVTYSYASLSYNGSYGGNVVIPEEITYMNRSRKVTSIGERAFYNCSRLTFVTIPTSVTTIGNNAFQDCTSLTSIAIPNSITTIGGSAFSGCNRLTSVHISDIEAWCKIEFVFINSIGSYTSNPLSLAGHLFLNGEEVRDLMIPNSVTNISNYAFYNCIGLTSVTIGKSVTSIGVKSFMNCSGITSVTIPNSMTNIEEGAFSGCIDLTSITIPQNVTSIGREAFYGCSNLTSIKVEAGNAKYDSRDNCNAIIETKNNRLIMGCQNTIIPSSVTSIGNKAFYCSGLTSITIPSGVISIGDAAFICSDLISVTIPNSVTSIGVDAFRNCNNLLKVISKIENPFNLRSDAFSKNTLYNGTLYVPTGTIEKYKSTSGWNQFTFISDKVTYKLTYFVDNVEYKSYEIEEGETVNPEQAPTKEGYTFSGWSDIPETMPAKDVTVTGTFTVNKYKLTYTVDDEEYKSTEVEYGSTITAETEPTKEGYTFSGWSDIPETMPANDVTVTGTFTVNKYKLTYTVDGEEYKSAEVEYGSAITAESEPTKEGYTFSGWSDIPETMPANNVTVTGTFTINKYKLTYTVDGEEYKSTEVEYGSAITVESEPTKEGYTFSGWSDIPETMPAKDVTVTGTFTVNKYKLTYTVDGEEYKSAEVEYGSIITAETEPTKEGYTFSGWSDIPETMPAKDVTVSGTFTINKYKVTYIIDGEEYKTEEVEYGSTITPPNPDDREGFAFAWDDYPSTMPANDITITGSYTATAINAILAADPDVKIYTVSGKPINKLQKGVNILRYKDGRTKKIVIK